MTQMPTSGTELRHCSGEVHPQAPQGVADFSQRPVSFNGSGFAGVPPRGGATCEGKFHAYILTKGQRD
jgi:hypothetical protein